MELGTEIRRLAPDLGKRFYGGPIVALLPLQSRLGLVKVKVDFDVSLYHHWLAILQALGSNHQLRTASSAL